MVGKGFAGRLGTHEPSRCAGCLDPGIQLLAAAVVLVANTTVCTHAPVTARQPASLHQAELQSGEGNFDGSPCAHVIIASLSLSLKQL